MPASVDQLFLDALALPPEARADLTDRLVANAGQAIPAEIERAHLEEVRRRMARVESGEVQLIEGQEATARVRAFAREQVRLELIHKPRP